MADILLNKSAVSQSISCVPDARFVFGFSPEDATLSRSGDDFVLTFEDGSTITLAGFYTTYSSEQMPSFSVEGAEISGEDFFTAMNEPDLMPAAGPAQQAADGARYRSWANMELLDGIDRLGGLDVGWQDPTPDDDDEGGADDINWPVSIVPGTPADTPDVPVYDENGNTVAPGLVVEHLIVHESALKGGNPGEGDESVTDSGSMLISARDGVQSITVNGVTVVSGEALTDTLEIATDEGVLTVTGFTFDAASGEGVLEFKFDLSNNTLEHKGEAGENSIGHVFTVTLTDPDNESASADIFVEVVDDIPEMGEVAAEGDGYVDVSGNISDSDAAGLDAAMKDTSAEITVQLEGLSFGADSDGSTVLVSVNGTAYEGKVSAGEDGVSIDFANAPVTLSADGQLVYTRPEADLSNAENETYRFDVTVTDADGDVVLGADTVYAYANPSFVPDDGDTPDQPGGDTPDQPGGDTPDQPGGDTPDQPGGDDPDQPGGDTPGDAPAPVVVDRVTTDDSYLKGGQDKAPADDHSASSASVKSSFSISLNGLAYTLTIGGAEFKLDANGNADPAGAVIEGEYGSITVNAIKGGVVSYTYNQTRNYEHSADQNNFDASNFAERFAVTVTDGLGQSASGSIDVSIEDDGPSIISAADAEFFTDDDTLGSASSNALFSFAFGADGEAAQNPVEYSVAFDAKSLPDGLTALVDGDWQEVSLSEDGTQLLAGDKTVAELVIDGDGKVTFTQHAQFEHGKSEDSAKSNHNSDVLTFKAVASATVTDADGDSASDSANITITISDSGPSAENDAAGWVKADTVLRDNADAAVSRQPHTLEGSVLLNDKFGADGQHSESYVSWGKMSVGGTGSLADYGRLELGEDGSYRFVLNNESDIVKAMLDSDSVSVSIDYVITDGDGDTSSAVLTFEIKGADDGITVVPGDPESMPDPDQSGEGSSIVAEHLTVHESALVNGNPAPEKGETTASGSMKIAAPDGLASIKIGATEVWKNGSLTETTTVSTDEGVLTVTGYAKGELSFSFTLNQATQEHSNQGEDSISHKFAVTVSDKDGDSASSSIVVTVVDDMPKAEPDAAGWVKADTVLPVNADKAVSNQTHLLEGTVLSNDQFGADGQHAESYVSWGKMSVGGTGSLADYGTLELGKNGSYSFVLNNESDIVKAMLDSDSVSVSIDYVITDGDGDTSSAVLTFEIKGADDGITVVPGNPDSMPDPDQSGEASSIDVEHLTVHESALVNGNPAPEEGVVKASGSMEIAAPDGLASIKIGETEVWKNGSLTKTTTVSTDEGVLTVTGYDVAKGELSFSFTLNQATQEHSNQGEDSISHKFAVTVSDKDGDSASSSIVVTVVDDMPVIVAEGTAAEETPFDSDVNQQADGMQSLSGTFAVKFGADGMAAAPFALVVSATETRNFELNDGKYSVTTPDRGTLTLEAVPGSTSGEYAYTYVPSTKNDSFFDRVFTIQMKDKDGDTVTTTVTVERDFTPDLAIGNDRIVVDEGTQPEGDHEAGLHPQSGDGSFTVDLHGESGSVSFGGYVLTTSGVNETKPADGFVVNGVRIYNAALAQGENGQWTVSYSYEFAAPQTHGARPNTDASLSDSISVTVTDAGGTATGSITVELHDDIPQMTVVDPATVMQLPGGDGPIFISTGSVTANAGSDGTVGGVQFDTSAMSSLTVTLADGTTGDATVVTAADGKSFTISLNNNVLFEAELGADGYTAEQYEIFSVAGSNDPYKLDIRFKLSDTDGDTAVDSIFVPLKLDAGASGNVHNDGLTGTNHGETITLPSGGIVAGSMGAGDSGGVSVTSGVSYPTYNVSIMLDLSASMHRTLADGNYYDGAYTRMSMAVESLLSFFDNVLARYEGQVNFHLVGFGQKSGFYNSFKTNAGYTEFTASFNSTSTAAAARSSLADLLGDWLNIVNKSNYTMATNYMLGLNASKAWFNSSSAASDGYNLAYLLTDGEPTKYILSNSTEAGDGNVTDSNTKTATETAANSYKSSFSLRGGVDLNCIGMGQGISNNASAKAMLDYIDSSPQCVVINSASELTAALSEGSTTMQAQLAQAGSDVITANDASVIYGDMFNTDDLVATMTQEHISHAFKSGSGYAVFQWLENPDNAGVLENTSFEGWTKDMTAKFIYEHAEEIGWETAGRIVTDSAGNQSVEYYLIDVYGNVRNTSGSIVTNVSVNDLTITRSASSASNPTGSDTITGSSLGDLIFGQEGNDVIDGGAGDDIVFGGTGNDTIKGGAGNDFIVGGYGSDTLYGGNDASGIGSGNDIFVYDAQDIFHGGDGIDFLLSTGTENLSALSGTDKVNDIEVLIKGEGSLSLTSMDALADKGITVETKDGQEVLKLDSSKWEGKNGVYNNDDGLTIETSLHESGDADFATDAIILQLTTTSN